MQTLTSVRRRGWSGQIASLPLSFFFLFLVSLPRPQVALCVRSGPIVYSKIKCTNPKIVISRKCLHIFAPNFAHLFDTILCISVLLCAVFIYLTYVKLTETQASRTNFTTVQKVEFIIKVTEQQVGYHLCCDTMCVIIFMFTCNVAHILQYFKS